MATPDQMQANRANAAKSTGPRTPEGIALSSLNAVQHGFNAKTVVLPNESPEEYADFRRRLLHALRPANDLELLLAHRAVLAAWRMRRAQRYELRLIGFCVPAAPDPNNPHAAPAPPPQTSPADEFPAPPDPPSFYGKVAQVFDWGRYSAMTRYESAAERSFFRSLAALAALRRPASPAQSHPAPQSDSLLPAAPAPPAMQIWQNEPTNTM